MTINRLFKTNILSIIVTTTLVITIILTIHAQATAEQLTGAKIQNLSNIHSLTAFKNQLYLVGNMAVRHNKTEPTQQAIYSSFEFLQLWKYNGNSVSMITDANSQSQPKDLVIFKNALYFTITDSEYGVELCKFDGKNVSVIDIEPGKAGSQPMSLTVSNNELYFLASTYKTGRGLWKYDGVKPTFLAAIASYPNYSSPFIEFNHELYFSATDAEHGNELWKYNGKKVSLVADIHPGKEDSAPFYFATYKNQLFFFTDTGYQLWKYDGKKASLVMKVAGNSYEMPSFLTVFKNELYFKAHDDQHGWKLWKYDGKKTYLAADEGGSPDNLTVFGGQLYFSAINNRKRNLWKFDGKKATLVADDIYYPRGFTILNNALYFIGEDSNKSDILWKLSAK